VVLEFAGRDSGARWDDGGFDVAGDGGDGDFAEDVFRAVVARVCGGLEAPLDIGGEQHRGIAIEPK
jgi:hypothetical protein